MESTRRVSPLATVTPVAVIPDTLLAGFAQLPDPRRAASTVYPVKSLLALTVSGLLANQGSVVAIAEWAARQRDAVLGPIGLAAGKTPCQSTL